MIEMSSADDPAPPRAAGGKRAGRARKHERKRKGKSDVEGQEARGEATGRLGETVGGAEAARQRASSGVAKGEEDSFVKRGGDGAGRAQDVRDREGGGGEERGGGVGGSKSRHGLGYEAFREAGGGDEGADRWGDGTSGEEAGEEGGGLDARALAAKLADEEAAVAEAVTIATAAVASRRRPTLPHDVTLPPSLTSGNSALALAAGGKTGRKAGGKGPVAGGRASGGRAGGSQVGLLARVGVLVCWNSGVPLVSGTLRS
jgi:hypothetical protein